MSNKIRIRFVSQQKIAEVQPGATLLDAAAAAGVPVEGNCGGKGTCGKCKVRIVSGYGGEPSQAEVKHLGLKELEAGWVLACQCRPEKDMAVEVPVLTDAGRRKVRLQGGGPVVKPDPAVEKVYVRMEPPGLDDQGPDYERLLGGLEVTDSRVNLELLASLPRLLRDANFQVAATLVGGRLAAVERGDATGRKYGLAFDLGTTTVVGWLVDLDTGDTLAARAVTNPQNVYGADVISRIGHAGTHEGLRQLQQKILAACNEIIRCLLDEGRVAGDEIYEIVAVGNTTMSHLFLGIDPTFLATAPYVPAFAGRMELEARELGLDVMPAGRVVVLPNIAGYVGSDTVGVMLATDIGRRPGFCLAVDIGTNGEVVLAGRGRLLTCSTAAGPAFEGARIRHGMRAAAGAIEGVRIDGGEVGLEVIDDATPLGICGSGLLDAAAAMVQVGLISPTGRLLPPESLPEGVPPGLKERLRRGKDGTEFVLAQDGSVATGEDIVITQKDIRELQLAKAAIYAGIQVLLKELEVTPEEIDEILLAGAFGNYIKIDSALALGLLPAVAPGRIKAVGNAAGDGARMALISGTARAEASDLARRAGHVELSTWPDFQDEFVNAMYFPKQG